MSEIEIGVGTLRFEGNPAKLYEALAKAQVGFTPIPRSKTGQSGNRNFKYADYATIMRCVRPALAENGITVLQPLHSADGSSVTTTILAGHGAAIISSFSFPNQKDPQDFGKHHTYYRRYQLQSMLGLEGDKDADDLPDVNEEHAQQQGFTDAAPPVKETKPPAAPKASANGTAKPAPVSAEPKPAVASEPKTNGSAKPSVDSTASSETKMEAVPSAEKIVEGIAPEKLNSALTACMKQFTPPWRLINVREFFAEHFDPNSEMPHPDNMDPALKRRILAKIIEVKNVAPF